MRLLVLGNAAIDLSYSVSRLPIPGETLLAGAKQVEIGGKGLNQAVVAARAGAPTRLVAAVGDDWAGAMIRDRLAAEKLDPSDLHIADAPTDELIVMVTPDGENTIVSTAAAAARLPLARVVTAIDALAAGDLLLLQGNLSREVTEAALSLARQRRVVTMLNPSPIAFDYAGLFQWADIAIVNMVEATALGPIGAGTVILTEGAHGARLLAAGRESRVPAPAVAAVDTTGAGDVVCGVVAAGLALGLAIEPALNWAMAAAARKVTRHGAFAGLPSAAELHELRPLANRA